MVLADPPLPPVAKEIVAEAEAIATTPAKQTMDPIPIEPSNQDVNKPQSISSTSIMQLPLYSPMQPPEYVSRNQRSGVHPIVMIIGVPFTTSAVSGRHGGREDLQSRIVKNVVNHTVVETPIRASLVTGQLVVEVMEDEVISLVVV